MPLLAYRAKQSTDTSGTGTLVLNAAASNARSFQAAFGNASRRIPYMIQWANGFEYGLGDFDGGNPGSLTRATVLLSSNANALVTLPAGTKDVFTVFDPAANEIISIAATATLSLSDIGNTVVFTGASAATLNFPAIAAVPVGAGFMVLNQGSAALTLDPNGAETINGAATIVIQPQAGAFVRRISTGWLAQKMIGDAVNGNITVNGNIQSNGSGGNYALLSGGASGGFLNFNRGGSPSQNAFLSQDTSGSFFIKNLDIGSIVFTNTTSDTERARIDPSGNFLVGINASNFSATVNAIQLLPGNGLICSRTGTANNVQIGFNNANGPVGSISTSGSSTSFNTSSDYRLKEDVCPLQGAMARVMALKPVSYRWKVDGSPGDGFLAHELAEHIPSAVRGEKDAVDADGQIQAQGVDYSKLVVHLVAALQEIKAENDALRLRVEALEARE